MTPEAHKRVLILAYAFPPSTAAGARRPAKLAEHLTDCGWSPVVLTAGEPARRRRGAVEVVGVQPRLVPTGTDARTRRDPVSRGGVRRWAANVVRNRFFVPDAQRGWIGPATRRARRLHAERPFDAVVATAPPFSALLLGLRVKRALGVPLVAEFRDPWSHSFADLRAGEHPSRLARERAMEADVVAGADLVLVTAPNLRDEFLRDYPHLTEGRVACIPNGCDLDDYTGLNPWPFDGFTILYTGTLERQQAPEPFLDALASLPPEKDWAFHVAGSVDLATRRRVAELGLDSRVTFHGPKDHETIRRMQLGADVLVVMLGGSDPGRRISGKVFEYLCVDSPLLAIVPRAGATADVLAAAGAGTVVDPGDTAALFGELARLVDGGRAAHRARGAVPSAYDRRAQAKVLARLLDSLPAASASDGV